MRPISVDFSPSSFTRTALRTSAVVWTLILFGLSFCVAAALNVHDLVNEREARQVQIKNLESELSRHAAPRPQIRKSTVTELQAKAINQAIAQLNLPWQDVLDAMEAATPASIALLSLEPDGRKHLLKVSAEAKNLDEMLSYIDRLKQQEFFASVMLSKHEINEQDPNKPIRFQFEAYWISGES